MRKELRFSITFLLMMVLLPLEAFAFTQDTPQNIKNLEIKWLEADELDVSWGYNEEPKFKNGYATFQLNDKYGLVDRKGNVVIPAKYKSIKTFHEGLAVAQFNDKLYLVNKKGQEFDLSAYDDVGTISEGILSVKKDNKWGYFDENGKEIVAPKYTEANEFKEGIGRVAMDNLKAYGFVDKNGKEITAPTYFHAKDFQDGMALVLKYNSENQALYGYIDKTGKEVIPAKYSKAFPFHEGFAIVGGNPEGSHLKFGFINKKGEEIVPIKYAEVRPFTGGFARVRFKEEVSVKEKWGYVDEEGKEILIDQFNRMGEFVDGIAWFELGGQYGYVDKNGELVPAKYDRAYDFKNGFARVELSEKYGFIDKTGKEIVSPKYGWADDFNEGLAAVLAAEKNEQGTTDSWFLNEKGQEQVKGHAADDSHFNEGLLKVHFADRLHVQHLFYLDKNGNKVIDLTGSFTNGSDFVEGYALLTSQRDGKVKYAFLKKPNLGNTQVVQPKRDTIPAKYSRVKLNIDGAAVSGMEIYNIAENNYFKLRDVAKLLEATEKRFSVDWNNEKKLISLQTGLDYQTQGNELSRGDKKDKTATVSDAKMELNGEEVKLSAYKIADNNYFKLRDLCDLLGVKVDWDQSTATVLLRTK